MSSQSVERKENNANSATKENATVGPPKPPRSAFMCFSDSRQDDVMIKQGVKDQADILKLLAEEWRQLDDRDRAYWDEEARNDKVRYVREKANYAGPTSAPKRRAKKHPLAPKRPMSAFLKYSQNRRSHVKEKNPDMSNTDVSRLLGEMWRNACPSERQPYIEQEERERAAYKEAIKKWREDQAKVDVASRTSHHDVYRLGEGASNLESYEPLRIHSADDASDEVDERPFPLFSFIHQNEDTDRSYPRMFRHSHPPHGIYGRQPHRSDHAAGANRGDVDYRNHHQRPGAHAQGFGDGSKYSGRSPYFSDTNIHSHGYYHYP